jgi:cytokinin riboside 5'-monophosphate phosphoribohydrolase
MESIRAVTVYCSSSKSLDPIYYAAGAALGRAIAREKWDLVYGGNHVGLMATLADAARAAGGRVVGITPQLFIDQGVGDTQCDELVITENIRDRKAILEQRGDAFVALPGGLGTYEEIFDIVVHRQLGYHDKPIVLLNVDGYYDPLIQLIEHGVEKRFIKMDPARLFLLAPTVDSVIAFLRSPMHLRHTRGGNAATSSAAE